MQKRLLVHIYYVLFSIGWLFSKMLFNKYIEDICFEIGLSISFSNDEDKIVYTFQY